MSPEYAKLSNQLYDKKKELADYNEKISGYAKMVRFQVWDAFPLSEFYAGKSKETYDKRFDKLIRNIQLVCAGQDFTAHVLAHGPLRFRPIPFRIVINLDEAVAHFEELLAAGEEGTILKNFCGYWEDTRSKHLVKMKSEKDVDLEIIGWNPGTGKFEGMVGSLICASSDRKVEVSISGFSDELRQWITGNIDDLIGKIATVLYNERIKSKARTDVDSLFLPRFVEFRSDKSVSNSSKEIK